MMQYSKLFPWQSVKTGQGFFVPCVNTDEVRLAGLNEALRHRIVNAKAYPAIRNGLSGIWFYR